MFGAIKQPDGLYSIVEMFPFRQKTYSVRSTLKDIGAKWNPVTKRWEDVREQDLCLVGASKQIKVRIEAKCHELERDIFCFESEIKDGCLPVSCSWCDTGRSSGLKAKILKIYGEK